MKKVFIYRNEILPLTETFIYSQASALDGFEAQFVGLKKVSSGLPVQLKSILLTEDDSPPSRIKRSLFREFTIAPKFLDRLRQEKPDLIHAHFAVDGIVAMRLAEKLNIPLVVTLHGYDVTYADHAFSRSREGRRYLKRREELWEKTTKFLCSCSYIMDRAAAIGFPKHKMEVLYSGHRLERYTPGMRPRSPNLVLFVGRLVEKKGCEYLLRAVSKVAKIHPAVEVAVIGTGPLLEPLEHLAQELKVNCKFLGSLMDPAPGDSVYDWMRRARVFCVPSVTASDGDTEGQPAVFVEAHGFGLPAVSFRTAGISEAVLHEETGLLAPEKDVDTLAEYILRLIKDDAFWEKCSKRGRSWVYERFDLNALTRQLQKVYWEALKPRPVGQESVAENPIMRQVEHV